MTSIVLDKAADCKETVMFNTTVRLFLQAISFKSVEPPMPSDHWRVLVTDPRSVNTSTSSNSLIHCATRNINT
jgi:hypothetical protein